MATEIEHRHCDLCGASKAAGQLLLGAELRGEGAQWQFVKNLCDYALCDACYWLVAGVAQGAASSMPGAVTLPLGAPRSESSVKRPGYCDYCDGALGDESIGIELVTDHRRMVRRIYRHTGTMVRQRVCAGCARWWIAALRDPTALTGRGRRALEGAAGGWIGQRPIDVVPVHLSQADATTLEQTVVSMGTSVLSLSETGQPGKHACFVRAGRRESAAGFVAASRARARHTIVVAALDALEDAREALLAGAADLLAEPLTPNQIAGALDRLGTGWAKARDSRTGIPVPGDGLPQALWGLPGADLVFADAPEPPLVTYLGLRRMLRGFDFVGLREGAVTARVYALNENVQGIAERLGGIMGVAPVVQPVGAGVAERAA
jgi:hypothetical protein